MVLAAALCALTSCQKVGPMGPEGPRGPQGPQGDKGDATSFIYLKLEVPVTAWKYSGYTDNNFFVATINVPEITEEVFDFGMVNLYRTYNFDSQDASQIALPSNRLCEDLTDPSNPVFYTEQVDFEYGIGWIKIYFTVSDFVYETIPFSAADIGPMLLRCVISYQPDQK